ncbi:hypothetical protein Phpb_01199 [Photorhabdus namnaonensis]|uniref:Uncharacterized protein n=1 Tax=Photorhabdus namnaonensis TaxID=1851568 RepID=A0A1B8YKN5_9GAMM|nr:hypothetical protein Phpb_01199 [Photorhabdus namnaonensis]
MPLWGGGAGDAGGIIQVDRIEAAGPHAVGTAPLFIITVIHPGLVAIGPAAYQALRVIFIVQMKMLGAVRFRQPAVIMVAITGHHFL